MLSLFFLMIRFGNCFEAAAAGISVVNVDVVVSDLFVFVYPVQLP